MIESEEEYESEEESKARNKRGSRKSKQDENKENARSKRRREQVGILNSGTDKHSFLQLDFQVDQPSMFGSGKITYPDQTVMNGGKIF